MSRSTPTQPYGYAPPQSAATISPGYYYEDPAEYVGDYSENEGLHNAVVAPRLMAPSNLTEIYRSKPALATPEHYGQQNVYGPPSYYYESLSPQVLQQIRRPVAPTAFRCAIPVVNERNHYYTPETLEDSYRNPVVYSCPQIATVRRSPANTTPSNRQLVRRHPITVRTPRYYRRSTMSNVYKKPSALCLPVACQPDPAVYPRIPRKLPEDSAYTSQQFAIAQQTQSRPMLRRHTVPAGITNTFTNTQQMANYPRALQVTQYEVDAALARYETILGDSSYEAQHITKVTSCSNKSSVNNSKSSKNKIISHMKPKVPFSIKQKQEQSQKIEESAITTREKQKHRPNSPCNVERLELEEITTEVLDNMLSELLKSGCENRINEKNLTENTSDAQDTLKFETGEKGVVERPPSGTSKAESSQCSKSFNYQDISQNMSKSKHNLSKLPTNDDTSKSLTNSQTSSPVNSPRFGPTSISNVIEQTYPKSTSYICVDQNSAIELHRSKSYIVGLIDRALSKELGTIPERPKSATASHCSSRKNEQMNARQAINLINKNCNNMDKGLCLEITQALAESIVSHSAPTHHKTEDKHSSCSCNVQDEPLYVKQLKQLRWGHLKHIQREVKRLEDLERFLDSCSSGSANN